MPAPTLLTYTPTRMTPKLAKGDPRNGQTATAHPPADGMMDSLRHLRARSPQESLGLKTERGLLKAFVQAALVTGVVFAALTVGPYYLQKQSGAAPQTEPAPAPADAAPPAAPPPSTPAPDATAKKTPAPAADPGKPAGKKDLMDVLGEGGTKKSSPKVNPLDRKDDDLLKDLNPK